MTFLLLSTVTAADGAARGVSLVVVLAAGLAVYLISIPQVRRERRELEERAAADRARREGLSSGSLTALGRIHDAERERLSAKADR